jgi:NADH dehydrogenase
MPINIPESNKPRVVIIGGGFGGIRLARALKNAELQVVMIDRNNYHTFQPLLYQVATGGLEPDSIGYPLRKIFKQKNFIFRMAEAVGIDPRKNSVQTSIGEISYDHLVVAVGSKTNYFGMADMEKHAFPMKTIPQAMELRNMILQNFEKALLTNDLEEQQGLMNIVVVGGGPTGVETAGALGELKKHVLPRDYPELYIDRMQIHIIEKEDRLMKTMSTQASEKTAEFLKRFGVNIWLKAAVTSYDGKILGLANGKRIISYAVIWTSGVRGALIPGIREDSIINDSRYKTDHFNRIDGYDNIFAIGDVAAIMTPENPHAHPMVAPVAVQQGRHLARNLLRVTGGRKMVPFVYRDLGMMSTVGRNRALADLKFVKFQGIFAWFIWMFLHLMLLVGFRNRLVVFVNWAWNYFSYDRGIRLILRSFSGKQ